MCGICGIASASGTVDPGRLAAMSATLVHRGPDSDGTFVEGPVGLAARRLAIIDLATGDQPIANEAHRITVVQNGEIYNYRALREELRARGFAFRTTSDTEVILRGYEAWGVGVLQRLRGMFAFAIWDRQRRPVQDAGRLLQLPDDPQLVADRVVLDRGQGDQVLALPRPVGQHVDRLGGALDVGDDPAPVAEWLPVLAAAIGAKPPRRVPAWLARLFVGEHGVVMMTESRGASNAKAKRELGWQPAYPSWRTGFRVGLGSSGATRAA